MKILVADDVASNRIALSLMLAPYGEVDLASSGAGALECVRAAWDDLVPYDFICLDFFLLDMTGDEVLRILRREENGRGFQHPVKILCATSCDDRSWLAPFLTDPDAHYIEKPLTLAQLDEAMRRFGFERIRPVETPHAA